MCNLAVTRAFVLRPGMRDTHGSLDMDDVNESLGRKIAGLDLSEAEAAALVVAFGGRVEAEVSGFVLGLGELQECTISKPLLGQMRSAEWFVADRFIFYEDEMGSQRR